MTKALVCGLSLLIGLQGAALAQGAPSAKAAESRAVVYAAELVEGEDGWTTTRGPTQIASTSQAFLIEAGEGLRFRTLPRGEVEVRGPFKVLLPDPGRPLRISFVDCADGGMRIACDAVLALDPASLKSAPQSVDEAAMGDPDPAKVLAYVQGQAKVGNLLPYVRLSAGSWRGKLVREGARERLGEELGLSAEALAALSDEDLMVARARADFPKLMALVGVQIERAGEDRVNFRWIRANGMTPGTLARVDGRWVTPERRAR